MSGFHDNALIGASGQQGYQISRSVRLRSSASAFFNRTPASAGNRRTWTWSGWVKRGALGGDQVLMYAGFSADYNNTIRFNSDNTIYVFRYDLPSITWGISTTPVYRDPSGWYHIVVSFDTTQATAANRVRLFVNGTQINTFTSSSYPAQNADNDINNTVVHRLGNNAASNHFDGYLTDINFIDGQALTPSSFGETNAITGVWQPKKYTGTYGTNGFYLNFSDNSAATAAAIGADYSGNGNNWTANNISLTSGVTYDSMTDVPTLTGEGAANYCVLNGASIGTDATLSNANLTIAYGSGATRNATMGTMGMSSGKWYFEATITASSLSACAACIGITNEPSSSAVSNYPGFAANGWGYDGNQGYKYNNGSGVAYGATYGTNDVIGVAFDADAGSLTFYKNNVSQGAAYTGIAAGTYFPAIGDGSGANTFTAAFNFGQRPFAYTPPTGFKALNTQNLPDSTIPNGSKNFDVSLWTGDQAARTITNNGSFQPDLVWTKSRSAVESHRLHDSVRGGNGTVLYELNSNETSAEGTDTLVSGLTSNGFTIASGANSPNVTGRTYVGWQWKGGGAAVTNTAGSISSQVSANPNAGFSVVTYSITSASATISTFGHGLGVAPNMVILKVRNAVDEWTVYHSSISTPNSNWLTLNTTSAAGGATSTFSQSSTTFGVRETRLVGSGGSGNILAYCFSEVAGYSKFGSYTGNGSADGPMVFTGFLPRWVLIKCSSAAGTGWYVYDTVRNTYNVMDLYLRPDASDAETTFTAIDCLSNGFKLRTSNSQFNGSGSTYVYAAFASNPFKNALAR